MDKLQLDVIFLSETFRAPPEDSTSQIEFRSRAGFCTIEMTNANRRRGIQFRVRSHLEPLVTPILCFKDTHVEILSITIRGLLIIGVYAPDGKETEGTDVLLSILERAVSTGYGTILVVGDPNAKACALGNPSRSRNKAGRVLDSWLTETDCVFEVIPSPEPTYRKPGVTSFLDLILIHGLHSDSVRVTQHKSLASDHDGLEIQVQLAVSPSCPYTPSRINPKRLNRHLTRTLAREGGITMKAFLDVVAHEATLSHLGKHKNKERKARARYFSPSSRLQALGKEMLLARKTGQRQRFLSLRRQYCKLLRFEKRKAFQLYKEEVSRQPQIREFCRLMDRLRPQKSWSVNVGDHREDEIGGSLLRIQSERPSSMRFQETQLLRLSCADVEDRHNQEPCFDMHDLNSALVSCSLRKSPGPSGLRYEHWHVFRSKPFPTVDCNLHPRVL